VAAELFHADGRTDRQTSDLTKLIVAFRSFANKQKNPEFEQQRSPCGSYRKVCSDLHIWAEERVGEELSNAIRSPLAALISPDKQSGGLYYS
jgi:hypothetical protein